MTSRGLSFAADTQTRKGFVLFWAAVFLMSLLFQYGGLVAPRGALADSNTGAIWTTDVACGGVDLNVGYQSKTDVYLNGGPNGNGQGLADGFYWVKVESPSGTLLGISTSADVHVTGGHLDHCYQLWSVVSQPPALSAVGYLDTDNSGGEYKVTISQESDFPGGTTKSDNFKVDFSSVTATHVSSTSITLGGSVIDHVTVTGNTIAGTPGGAVQFFTCAAPTCSPATGTLLGLPATLDASGEAESIPFTPGAAGSYAFAAAYTPDANSSYLGSVDDGTNESFEVTVEPPTPVVSISKANTTGGTPVAAGSSVNYTLTLHVASGPAGATTIVDQLPTGIGSASAISDGGIFDSVTNRISWNLASVADGKTLTYSAVVSGTSAGNPYVNTATIQGCEGQGCSATSNVNVLPPTIPALSISKSNSTGGTPVAPGTSVNYTVTLHVANGPAGATTIVDQLPTGIGSASSVSDGGSYDAGTNRITWTLSSVADGKTLTYSAVVSASATATGNPYVNTVTIEGCEGQGCSATSNVNVQLPPPPPPPPPPAPQLGSLTITKSLNPATSFPGGTFTFNVSCATQQTITLAAGQASGSVTINNLVLGTSCTVTEVTPLTTAGSGWTWVGQPQYAPGQTVNVPATVTVTNFRGQVEAATATPPRATLPPTDTDGLVDQTTSTPGISLGLLLIIFSGLMLAIGFLTPVPSEIQQRNRRG
jgi:hypothetical protein